MSDKTRCDLFGHFFSFCKEGGQCYMKCEYCPTTRNLTADDLKAEAERLRALPEPEYKPPAWLKDVTPEQMRHWQERIKGTG